MLACYGSPKSGLAITAADLPGLGHPPRPTQGEKKGLHTEATVRQGFNEPATVRDSSSNQHLSLRLKQACFLHQDEGPLSSAWEAKIHEALSSDGQTPVPGQRQKGVSVVVPSLARVCWALRYSFMPLRRRESLRVMGLKFTTSL